mgnify:CR=1 FL=1
METIFDRSTLEELGAGLRGAAYVPGEEGYDQARKAWNLNAHHHPALVVMAAGAADVVAAVLAEAEEVAEQVAEPGVAEPGIADPGDGDQHRDRQDQAEDDHPRDPHTITGLQ